MKIAVSGSTGLIGSALVPFLADAGHEVRRIVHTRPQTDDDILWDQQEMRIDAARLEGLDAVIQLPGDELLSMRWSEQKKMQLYSNRVRATERLARTLARLHAPPRVFVAPAAIGYYGNRGDEVLTEASPPGQRGFLTAVCQDWEAAAAPAADAGIRTVRLRTGVVLTPEAGALAAMLVPFRVGLGGCYGARGQFVSWIARDDAVRAVAYLLAADGLDGPFNLTAPEPVTMATLARTLGRVLSRPAAIHIPPSFFRLFYGEVADETVLQSTRDLPERLLAAGFRFHYPDLEPALRHLLKRPAAR